MRRRRKSTTPRPAAALLRAATAVALAIGNPAVASGAPAPAAPAAAPGPASAGGAAGPEIVVYAAASLREALERIAPPCVAATGARLVFNFGASDALERQIEAANRADLFFPADEACMDRLDAAGFVDATTRRALLTNRLAVIAPEDSTLVIRKAADLAAPAIRRLSLADPQGVPAGRYARAWLEAGGAWEAVRGRVLPALDVRAALAAVESGAADAGIVYRTDAAMARRIRILYEVPTDEGPRILYPAAALRDRPGIAAARRVLECFAGEAAAGIFASAGFGLAGPRR